MTAICHEEGDKANRQTSHQKFLPREFSVSFVLDKEQEELIWGRQFLPVSLVNFYICLKNK